MRLAVLMLLSATFLWKGVVPVWAEPPSHVGIDPAEVARWPVEVITLKNDRQLTGLIRLKRPKYIEFVEVRRKPGEPMRRVVHVIRHDRIAKIKRLPERERIRLSIRLREFLKRTEILEGLLEDVELAAGEFEGRPCLCYEGPWFTLRSRADEATTRLAIVRLEQVFAGFRTYLAPRRKPKSTLTIVLLGSSPEYQELLDSRRLDIRQTAFFDSERNEIVAGGRLASIASELEEVRIHHEQLSAELRQKRTAADEQIDLLRETLQRNGNSQKQITLAVREARGQWKTLRDQLNRKISLARRRNDGLYHQAFRHLYHEAFHAYLSNFVMEDAVSQVPRWLNEGWAQIFESGLLESGALRVDAPSPERLQRLREELEGDDPLTVADILTASPQRFHVGQNLSAGDAAALESSRLYLYSWGLAYHLTFHRRLLGSSAMEAYLGAADAKDPQDEVARFEELVGVPLKEFEAHWRRAILGNAR